MNEFLIKFRVLPLLVLVAMAAFAVRIGDTFTGVRNIAAEVMAEESAQLEILKNDALKLEAIMPAAGTEENAANDAHETGPQPSADNKPKVSLPDETLPEVWADPGAETLADSPEQMQLLEDLAARRETLDARERALNNKAALLKATEKQLSDKITEMTAIKDQLEKLLGQQSAEEEAKIASLVKIYEGMKAKSAAEIFNQMDMGILVQVISKMSERKASPILAAMDTHKANELTVRLSEMQKLPGGNMNGRAGPIPTAAPTGSAALPGLDALGAP